MIVDDAIVVLESISRCRHEGDGLIQAAVRGVSEVAGAVTASTLTAMAVFFPIVFVEGIAGQLFGDQALTVVVSRFLSLLFAFVLHPDARLAPPARDRRGRGVFSNPFGGMAWRNVLRWIPNLLLGIGRTMLFVLATAFRGAFLVAGGSGGSSKGVHADPGRVRPPEQSPSSASIPTFSARRSACRGSSSSRPWASWRSPPRASATSEPNYCPTSTKGSSPPRSIWRWGRRSRRPTPICCLSPPISGSSPTWTR